MPALPLTKEQLEDAARLKHRFLAWQKRRRDAGLPASQEAISELLGFNQSAVSQYLNGRIPLNIEAAAKFASLIDCQVSDFSPTLAAQIEQFATTTSGQDGRSMVLKATPATTEPPSDTIPIKTVSIRLEAGFPAFEADQEFEDGGVVHIPRKDVELNEWVPQCLLAIKVRGDSMWPVFSEGDTIVINIADVKLVSGEVYAVNCEGKPVVKQMAYEGHQWYMRSYNPKHKPVPYRTPDSSIIGKVVYQPGRVISGRMG
jgi:phage repressor protein C with HTH and peptisase S24 domain